MTERLFVRDHVQIDISKIETDTDPIHGPTTIFKDVVIASEIVHEYEDGWAYKPADELEKAYWTWEGRWAKANDHPVNGIIMNTDDVQGKTVNLRFVKNLIDHNKTNRPNRRGILADLVVFNKKVAPETLADMKAGKKRDVSIGFFFTKDETPGNWNGMDYSYVQRVFMGDHTAFGLEVGRCSFPTCGIGADELITTGDPFAGYAGMSECIAALMKPKSEGGQGYTREQAGGTCAEIEKRSKEKHKRDVARTENERVMAHFNISEEEWEQLSEEEKKKYISKLPKRGSANMKDKIDEFKAKMIEALSGLDDLVEEEQQGNAELETEAERAKKFFNISEDDWLALSDEDKEDYISRLPPKKKRAGGEEMSEKDCVYEWDTVREKILDLPSIEPMVLSKIFGDMTFEEDSVTIPVETVTQLAELGVELDDCKCDDEIEEVGEGEADDYEELDIESEVSETKKKADSDVLEDMKRIWKVRKEVMG